MASLLAPLQARLNGFLLQHQLLMQIHLQLSQHRFPVLRRTCHGFVDLLMLLLVLIVDGIAAGHNFVHQCVVHLRNRCHVVITTVSNNLITALGLVADAFSDRYNAMRNRAVAFCRRMCNAALDIWTPVSERLAYLLPWRRMFHMSPTTAYLMVFGFGIYLSYFVISRYAVATANIFDFVVSTLLSAGVLLNHWSSVLETNGAQILHYLAILPYLVQTSVILCGISYKSDCNILSLPDAIRPLDYLPSNLSIALPFPSQTLPPWLHRPHIAIPGILVSGYLLSVAFYALFRYAANIPSRVAAATGPHWQRYEIVTIFGLSFVVWISNRDFAHILSTLITTAVDRDVNLLSFVFSCIRFATRICIWYAQRLVSLHQELERSSLDGKQWIWMARADWLEGCMCTLVIAAMFYAALFLCRRICNADICGSLRNAAARSKHWAVARFNGDIDGGKVVVTPDERSNSNAAVTSADWATSLNPVATIQLCDGRWA